ncbi:MULTISPECIES: recombinase family protein [unclassified Streptomyces]|uniref:recombinase family protein n=1 Tax=unclassified Streptomyces TaxID=2593676 RepID=UPI001BE67043|nr:MULTISPECIES: recombinase family protein [unclassified Streptomyces]MBT2406954.1 recombinase family protein [Streptomyces sp. ISL-21]MBT2455977.1 recombinase family protein [Streptomyces sp. ISL-86]MBT2610582.1 recombinase family protein [Streptomyces sp. ISL-87]
MGKALTPAVDITSQASGSLRAVDYLRVSTAAQAKGYGVAYTGRKTARYIQSKGWDHAGTYIDEGVSGSLEAHERSALNQLMDHARRAPRPFDMVVVNEGRAIGRTGRAWRWVLELEDLGVSVAVVKGDYDSSTAAGRTKLLKDADYAEAEWEHIRSRTQGGIQEKAEGGGFPGGQARFGYRIENQGKKGAQRLVRDECDGGEKCSRMSLCTVLHEAPVLRRGRDAAVKERGNWAKVALTLNAEGLFSRSGKPWTAPNIRRRLMDEDLLNARFVFRAPQRSHTGDLASATHAQGFGLPCGGLVPRP